MMPPNITRTACLNKTLKKKKKIIIIIEKNSPHNNLLFEALWDDVMCVCPMPIAGDRWSYFHVQS